MDSGPSRRELDQFLKRFDNDKTLFQKPKSIASEIQSPKDYVQDLLAPSFHELAITKVEGPLDKADWEAVGNTLFKLRKLGLSSIIVLDNYEWDTNRSPPQELTKRIFRESMALVESIEQAGGRARLIYNTAFERSLVYPDLIDINLDFILSTLDNNQIPIVIPILTERDGQLVPIKANHAVKALTNRLSKQSLDPKLTPSKVMVINKEGGIPNHHLPGTAHSLINVQEEYQDIEYAFNSPHELTWKQDHPNAMANLTMMKHCLEQLPSTSSAVIAPISSLPSSLITNLITGKPLYSSSLPVTSAAQINQAKVTVLRHGMKMNHFDQLSHVNRNRLTELLEASFKRKVDTDVYYKRLEHVLDSVIIAGDYEGAVIMTNEASHIYLDKFAIAPSSQGIGLTDILWKRMCDTYPNILWRSRKDNGVNKW